MPRVVSTLNSPAFISVHVEDVLVTENPEKGKGWGGEKREELHLLDGPGASYCGREQRCASAFVGGAG